MRMLQTVLALALSLATAGVASAVCETKKCPASEFGAAIDMVRDEIAENCDCNPDLKSTRRPYAKCVKQIVKSRKKDDTLTGACAKAVKKCSLKSTCGKPDRVACCQLKRNGSVKASIAKNVTKCQKKGSACPAFVSAFDACNDQGTCATVTSTSTTTITTTSTSTSSTTLPMCGETCPGFQSFDFTTGTATGSCGQVLDGSDMEIATLGCGGLDIGGGNSSVPEGPVPDGSVSRFAASCEGDNCAITASNCTGSLPGGGRFECTDVGCSFGPPLPIPNAGVSTCVVNTFREPAFGELNTATGESTVTLPLNSQTYLTGDAITPCPYCTNGVINEETGQPEALAGSLENPLTGTCAGGSTPDAPCTTTNSQGLTNDCLPGGVGPDRPCEIGNVTLDGQCLDGSSNLGGLAVTLANATTGTSLLENVDGFFCPGQDTAMTAAPGCFGALVAAQSGGAHMGTACRTISVQGAAAGPLTLGTPAPITLGSAFCIPAVEPADNIVNFSANLPGPGAVALIGTGTLSDECPLASSPSGAFLN